jgi:hypothetical protein
MTGRKWRTELAVAIVAACVVFLIAAVFAVPANSQSEFAAPSHKYEQNADSSQETMYGLDVELTIQMLLLWTLMISYLKVSDRMKHERHVPVHHWWSTLHLRHH